MRVYKDGSKRAEFRESCLRVLDSLSYAGAGRGLWGQALTSRSYGRFELPNMSERSYLYNLDEDSRVKEFLCGMGK